MTKQFSQLKDIHPNIIYYSKRTANDKNDKKKKNFDLFEEAEPKK